MCLGLTWCCQCRTHFPWKQVNHLGVSGEQGTQKNLPEAHCTDVLSVCNAHFERPGWHASVFAARHQTEDKLYTWHMIYRCHHWEEESLLSLLMIENQELNWKLTSSSSSFSSWRTWPIMSNGGHRRWTLRVTCRNDFWEDRHVSGRSHLILTLLHEVSLSEAAIDVGSSEEISRWPVKHN